MKHSTEAQKAYMREYIKDRFAMRKENGLCVGCGERLVEGCKILRCDDCARYAREQSRKHREKAKLSIIRSATNGT